MHAVHHPTTGAGNLRGCVAAVALAASLLPAATCLAEPAGTAPLPLAPTAFHVRNGMRATLYGFRIKVGEGPWLRVGDLPPGDSRVTALTPAAIGIGSFAFQLAAQRGGDTYLMGAYAPPQAGKARIELQAEPVDVLRAAGMRAGSSPGSFVLRHGVRGAAHGMRRAPRLPEAALNHALPLVRVPGSELDASSVMICASVSRYYALDACIGMHAIYFSVLAAGVGQGVAVGYFFSQHSAQELEQAYPVTALSLDGRFDARVFVSLMPRRLLGVFVGAGWITGTRVAPVGMFIALKPRPPEGSYQQTCTRIRYVAATGELYADCWSRRGTMPRSSLPYASWCHGGEVGNDDGQLVCERPPGSYAETCDAVRYLHGELRARCRTPDGKPHLSTLHYARDCAATSQVHNLDGALRCDDPLPSGPPPGPYLASCRDIRFRDGLLTANCGGLDTQATALRLDYRHDCQPGSEVLFLARYARPGTLCCAQPRPSSRDAGPQASAGSSSHRRAAPRWLDPQGGRAGRSPALGVQNGAAWPRSREPSHSAPMRIG